MILLINAFLAISAICIALVLLRQLVLTLTFHFGVRPPAPPARPNAATLPSVAIVIPAHNEELVLDGCLRAMRKLDYPRGRLQIVVIDDRSRDHTGLIADHHARQDPAIRVIHRAMDAQAGKPAALAETMAGLKSDIVVFFDADYLPPPQIVQQLVAPFADPRVGATMGRVVPYNTDRNMLTKLLDIERRAGYVVDQEMRQRLDLLPQFGGTCGAIRRAALDVIGGWRTDVLAEDTDLTYRMFIKGYRVAYLAQAMCYEESPESWQVRFRQVRRWSYGHNDCMLQYFWPTLMTRHQPLLARLDAALVLLFFAVPSLALASLLLTLASPAIGGVSGAALVLAPAVLAFCSIGNFAPYFQIAAGCVADRQAGAFRAAPMLFLSSFVSLVASVAGLGQLLRDRLLRRTPRWDKTLRFRLAEPPKFGVNDD